MSSPQFSSLSLSAPPAIPSPERWAIVGGGFLGLTLAHRLAQSGRSVTVFEAAPQLGGLASAWRLREGTTPDSASDGQESTEAIAHPDRLPTPVPDPSAEIVWDRHYHVTLLSDLGLRSLLRELGLEADMQWVETKTGCYANGQLYSVSNAIEFLKFPPLGWIDKIRLGFTILYASRIKNWRRLEKISAIDWLQRWSGRHTTQTFWLPLLRAKLGNNYTKASAAFIWAIIARLYAARRTGLKRELFGYLPGGYARLLERFAAVLQEEGVTLHLGQAIERVEATASGSFRLHQRDRSDSGLEPSTLPTVTPFDRVILTIPAPLAAELCPQLSVTEQQQLRQIQYQGILCASVLLKQSLSPYYVTNITDAGVPFTGVIEMTTLVNPQQFGGRHLVYLPKYVPIDDPAWSFTDAELQEQFISALERLYPHFQREDVLCFQVSRVKYVLAISTLNYSQQLTPMQTSVPGLHIINSAHILNGTLNVNETVLLAEQAAADLISQSQCMTRSASHSLSDLNP